jgi:hypothetical protein
MNFIRNDKVVLVKETNNMEAVGMTYEIANITDTKVVLRDIVSKVAICAIDIDKFEEHFKKFEDVKKTWTKWIPLRNNNGDIVQFYKTNYKKVQVKTVDNIRAEASCCAADEFNLVFGIRLASARCDLKALKKMESEYEKALKEVHSAIAENKNYIKKLLRTLDEVEE